MHSGGVPVNAPLRTPSFKVLSRLTCTWARSFVLPLELGSCSYSLLGTLQMPSRWDVMGREVSSAPS